MAEKNVDREIEETEKQLAELKAKRDELYRKSTHQEYPKWITDKKDPSKGYTVSNKDEEDAVNKGQSAGTASPTFNKTPEEEEALRVAKAEADKDAAAAGSRLSPVSEEDQKKADRDAKKADDDHKHKAKH
jgi:hypothetical protein